MIYCCREKVQITSRAQNAILFIKMINGPDEIKTLVENIACCLVDKPEEVTVDRLEYQGGIVYRLQVAPSDAGKVIGKQGRNARALRVILTAAGMKHKRHHSLDIQIKGDSLLQQ